MTDDETPDPRLLARCACFADAERLAGRRLPRLFRDYLNGACDGEEGLARNRRAFEAVELVPRYGGDVDTVDCSVTVLGRTWSAPVGVAPVGSGGAMWPDAERDLAAAASRHGLPFVASTASVLPIEAIAAAGAGHVWFQLYKVADEGITADLMRRVAAAGCDTLVVTVDLPVYAKRNRDMRNRLDFPFRLTAGHLVDMALHPAWTLAWARRPRPGFANFTPYARTDADLARLLAMRNAVTWADLAALRRGWPGRILVKGVLAVEDARRCVAEGVDGIVVSNHGGRQFDPAPASIDVLPGIAEAVAGRCAVVLDSGIRSGADVLRALARGADLCLAGRAFYWTVAALGPAGAEHAMRLFRSEIRTALVQAGIAAAGDRAALAALERKPATG